MGIEIINDRENKDRFIALTLFAFFIFIYLLSSSSITIYKTDASLARYEVTKSIVERNDD